MTTTTVTPAAFHRPRHGSEPFQPLTAYQARLGDFDYVEEEWFATGRDDNGEAYTTTVLVRRPRDPGRFSGTVIAEPLHFFPITPIFHYTSEYVVRAGHAWAYIGSEKASVDQVKASDPERYATVGLPAETRSAEAAGLDFTVVPSSREDGGDFWWEQLERQCQASRAILAEVGAGLRQPSGPFAGFAVDHVILAGHSGTGRITTAFIRERHGSHRLPDGSPVFDGFFPSGWPTTPFEGCGVPIVQTICEGDICAENIFPYRLGYAGLAYRRPDGDEPGDRFRLYELAGVAHTSTQHPPIDDLKFLEQLLPVGTIPEAGEASGMPFNQLYQMALHHLVRWVADGVAPPKAERLRDAPDGFFAKDAHGNTLGGVRTAHLDVPRATYWANVPDPEGKPYFGPYGFERPLDDATLARLYGGRKAYLDRFNQRLDELVGQGWFLAEDADGQRRDAENAAVPE